MQALEHNVCNDAAAIEFEQLRLSNVSPVEGVCHDSPLTEVRVIRVGIECSGTLELMCCRVPEPGKEMA